MHRVSLFSNAANAEPAEAALSLHTAGPYL